MLNFAPLSLSRLAAALLSMAGVAAQATTLGGCPVFPASAIFNTPIHDTARFPVHAQSAAWRTLIRTDGSRLHAAAALRRTDSSGSISSCSAGSRFSCTAWRR